MEKHENVYKRFLPLLPRYEPIILDSSAVSTWKECNRLYFYKYVLAKVPKGSEAPLAFGSAYHLFRERLSTTFLDWCKASPGNNYKNYPDSLLLGCIKDAIKLYAESGAEPPKGDRFDFLTIGRLSDSCRVAYVEWLTERKQGVVEVLATEFPFNFEYANGNRTSLRVDEIISVNGKYVIRDFKASSVKPEYYRKQLEPKDQAFRYILGVRKATGKRINDIWFQQLYNDKPTKTDNKGPLIKTHIVSVTESQLEEWEYEQQKIHIDINRSRELDIYPMLDNPYHCSRCAFRPICLANNANHAYSLLESSFKTHIWDNLEGGKDG